MTPIRVLVVDDSAVLRRLIADALTSDPEIEVVGTAANGRIALDQISELRPDVVTLDIEMPVLDGLGTLAELRQRRLHLPVIMFSTLTEQGAAKTLDALALGARDYVTKPSGSGSMFASLVRAKADLIPKVRALAGRGAGATTHPGTPPGSAPSALARASAAPTPRREATPAGAAPRRGPVPQRVDVVAIGVSTGGPNALGALLPALPADLPVPLVVVQHMPPMFTRLLAERLDACSPLAVREGVAGAAVAPGTAWIAPGGHHMVVRRQGTSVQLALTDDAPEHSCRPAVDPMLRSVVAAWGAHVLVVILTGMGSDGLLGAEVASRAGGQVVAQDQATSVVWGMPGEVVRAGLADAVVPLDRVADEIRRRVAVGRQPRKEHVAS